MNRHVPGLSLSSAEKEFPAGLFLVQVLSANYRWHRQKPTYELKFYVLEPKEFVGAAITSNLSCSPRSLWRLAWFLREFRHNRELLEQDEVDARAIVGLRGVIQVAREIVHGRSGVILTAFAPASDWACVTTLTNQVA